MEVNEASVAYSKRQFSIEEYLEMENAATEKHEYYQGEIFAMSGAKLPHNIVTSNLHSALGALLKGKQCRPFGSDTRVHIEKNTLFTYPDISIVRGKPESRNNDDMNLLNPTVMIEVTSPATRHYGRNQKFTLYQDIPTLKEYILVDPSSINIDAFSISSQGKWELTGLRGLNQNLHLNGVGISVPLSDIYEGLIFEAG